MSALLQSDVARRKPPGQLNLFPEAPDTNSNGGFRASGAIAEWLEAAKAKGCTHVEISGDGALLVTPALVGRDATARYLSLADTKVWQALVTLGRKSSHVSVNLFLQK